MASALVVEYLHLESYPFKCGNMPPTNPPTLPASPLDRQWDLMRVYLAVAEAGALLHGARKLGEPLSSVHRQIAALEAALETKLLIRSRRGVRLTPAGERLLAAARSMAAAAEEAEAALRTKPEPEIVERISGRLRRWESMRTFLALARSGTFVTAARQLGMSFETVRRQLSALETALGVTLCTRSKAGVEVTPAGETIAQAATLMEAAIADVRRKLASLDRRPEGLVRIATTDGLGAFWVAPRLRHLFERFPRLAVKLQYRPHEPDLLNGEADIWIGYSEPRSNSLVRLLLGRIHFVPVASDDYLARHSAPTSWEDLAENHHLLSHTYYDEHVDDDSDFALWESIIRTSNNVRLDTDLSMSLLAATVSGLGISLQPTGVLDHYPSLRVIDLSCKATAQFWLVYHEQGRSIAKYRAAIDACIEIMSQAGLR